MKRLFGLLCLILLSASAMAQSPFRFWQREESVDEVARNLSVITYEVGWNVPRPTNPEYPRCYSHIAVRFRWRNKDGSFTPEQVQGLRGQSWFGKPVASIKINRNFSASDDLKITMPRTAVACHYSIEIDSGIDTPGFTDRRAWRSPPLVQTR